MGAFQGRKFVSNVDTPPRLALEILKKAEMDAPGGILNRDTKREGDKPGEYERPVGDALKDKDLMAAQEARPRKKSTAFAGRFKTDSVSPTRTLLKFRFFSTRLPRSFTDDTIPRRPIW